MLTIEKKSLQVGRFVDTHHVNTVIRQYKQERWLENSRRIGKDDSLSVWYSVEELEMFLAKAKDHGANGVRMYFAEYPAGYNKDVEADNRQTIVMVATKSKTGATDSKDVYINDGNRTSILAYNFGQVCPNYCPGSGKGGGGLDGDTWGDIGTTLVDKGDEGMIVI
jgi:hypothetical protein